MVTMRERTRGLHMRFIVAVVLLVAAPPALGQTQPPAPTAFGEWASANLKDMGWIQLSDTDNSRVYFRDPLVVSEMPKVWFRYEVENTSSGQARSQVALEEFNCQTRQSRTLQMTTYSGQNMSGGGFTSTQSPWAYEIPGTVGEITLRVACGPIWQKNAAPAPKPTVRPKGKRT
jgi:hypothetical protein